MQFKFERCDGVDGVDGGPIVAGMEAPERERLAGAPLSCVSILDWIVVLDRLLL